MWTSHLSRRLSVAHNKLSDILSLSAGRRCRFGGCGGGDANGRYDRRRIDALLTRVLRLNLQFDK